MIRLSLLALVVTAAAGLAPADSLGGVFVEPGRGDLEQCIRLSSKAMDSGDLSRERRANAYYNRGSGYDFKGEFDRAIADYGEAIRLKPNFAFAYYARGSAYIEKGEYDRAIADLDAAIRLAPDCAQPYNDRGVSYESKGQYERAIADYDEAIRLAPNFSLAYQNRGNAFREMGKYDKSIVSYDAAIRLDPKNFHAYHGRGLVYVQKGQYDQAVGDFDVAISLRPDFDLAYNGRGFAYSSKEEYRKAIADYDTAIRLKPDYVFAYHHRGAAKFATGDFEGAANDYAHALAINASDAYAVLWLHIVRARAGKDDKQEFSRNAGRLDRSQWPAPIIGLYLGETRGEELRAAAAAGDAKAQRSRSCEVTFHTGELRLLRGARDDARRLFRKAVAGCPPGFFPYHAAKAELQRFDP